MTSSRSEKKVQVTIYLFTPFKNKEGDKPHL